MFILKSVPMRMTFSVRLLVAVGVVATLVLLSLFAPGAPAHAVGTVYYVDSNAAPGGSGTSTTPFSTISSCAQVAVAGDTCQIATGTYRETVTPANSGASGSPVTFAAATGATVTVTGNNSVSGWTLDTGNIYKASVQLSNGTSNTGYSSTAYPSDSDLWANQVFVAGAYVPEAQYPTPGSDPASPAYKLITAISGSTITDTNMPNFGDLTGAPVYFTGGWVAISGSITSNSSASQNFTYSLPSSDSRVFPSTSTGASNTKSFRIVGKKSLLTQAGEWFYDPATTRLYLWAPNGGVPTGVEAKVRNYSFDLQGKHDITVSGISTTASTIRTDSTSYDVVLDSITATYLSQWQTAQYDSTLPYNGIYDANHKRDSGIILAGHDNVIRNSRLNYSMGNALAVDGYNMTIQNNLITNVSYGGTYSSAVSIRGGSHDIAITQNTMNGSGRDMINLNTNIVSEETYKNISISHNEITNYARLADDLGGIYTCCDVDLAGSRFDHNWIHDPAQTGNGVHLDNGSWDVASIDHNVMWGLKGGSGVAQGGSNGQNVYDLKANITNNTFDVGSGYTIVTYYASTAANANQIVTNNILDGANASRDLSGNGNLVTRSSYDATGADPLYTNAAAGNFLLQTGSPAASGGLVVSGITSSPSGSVQVGAYEGGAFTPGCTLSGCTQPISAPTVPIAGHTYTITARHSGKVFDSAYLPTTSNPTPPSPSPIVQNAANGLPSQRWRMVPAGTGTYNLVNQETALCATTSGSSNGTAVAVSTCGSSTTQQFTASPLANGYNGVNFVSASNGLCLDIYAASQNDNGSLIQWTCGTQNNQQFQLTEAPLDATANLQAVFSAKNADAGKGTSSQIVEYTATPDARQAWKLSRGTDGYYVIASASNGSCLDTSTSSLYVVYAACTGSIAQKWLLLPAASGTSYRVYSAGSSDCLDVYGANPTDLTTIAHYACNGGTNQNWALPIGPITSDDSIQGTAGNQFNFVGSWGHATGETGANAPYLGTNGYTNTAGDTATYQFAGTGISYYAIKAPNHGIVAVSIDGGTETLVDLYAATRIGNQLVWSSAYLKAGTHTMQIRDTGNANPSSTNTYAVVDDVTVTP